MQNVNCEDNNERIFHTIIREICAEKGIDVKKLSYNWILELSKGDIIKHIAGNRFDLNPEAAGNIVCDKYATYEVLHNNNVPIIEHQMVFNPTSRSLYIEDAGIWSKVLSYFESCNHKLVVKPNNGCEGMGVYLCQTYKELEMAIHKLFKTHGSISICPYYEINTEYRTFYLDGEIHLIYGKTKPFVTGDGYNNIENLIKLNNIYLPETSVVTENLGNIDLEYVPEENEKYYISWKHNLSGGATPTIVTDPYLKNRISELVFKAAHVTNINFATIDVIKTNEDDLYVMEINSGVCMTKFIEQVPEGRTMAKKIYTRAIDKLFER